MGSVQSFIILARIWQVVCFLGPICLWYTVTLVRHYRRLRHFKGPRIAAWTELWLFNAARKGDFYLVAEGLFRRYGIRDPDGYTLDLTADVQLTGSPVRISPNILITDDPDVIRFMTAPRSKFRRGHWYRGMQLDPRVNNTLSEQDERRHSELRAKLLPGYTGKDVPTLEARIDTRVLELMRVMQRYADKQEKVDFAHVSQYLALDVLTDLAFGRPFGFLRKEKDLFQYICKSADFLPLMELGTNHPWIHKLLTSRLLTWLAGPKPTDKLGLGAVIGVAKRAIEARYERKVNPNIDRDMLDSFLERGLTQVEAESESLLQILAGADSAATCIRMTLLFLLTNPVAYRKLKVEVENRIGEGKISFPIVKNEEAAGMPYLQACIKESLRLWVPLNGLNTKVAPEEGVNINGLHIPGGTQVAHAHHSMMRRRDIFGANADMYLPERWLDNADPEKLKQQERTWELSFSYGRFVCLGKPIALMELTKVFVELFRRFDFGLGNSTRPITTKCHQIHIQEDLWVYVHPAAAT